MLGTIVVKYAAREIRDAEYRISRISLSEDNYNIFIGEKGTLWITTGIYKIFVWLTGVTRHFHKEILARNTY